MRENYKLCEDLEPKMLCFVVEEYNNGVIIRKFHKHIPKSRTSYGRRINILRSLVIHFSEMGAESIVGAYLNERSNKEPHSNNNLNLTFKYPSYPKWGVIRIYCGQNTFAWFDEVISTKKPTAEL